MKGASRSGLRRIGVAARWTKAPDIGEIIHRRCDTGQSLVILRSGHPAVRQRRGHWPEFVRRQFFQMLSLPPQNAHMWAEELVRRAGKKIAIPFLHVNEPMRR